MSGGSLDYICFSLLEVSGKTGDKQVDELIKDMANLLHDLEWCLSDDIGKEDYLETLKKFKNKWLNKEKIK